MYDWLIEEVNRVKCNKFHEIHEGLAVEPEAKEMLGILPLEYVEFLRRFGEARLFRNLTRGSYSLIIPRHPGCEFDTDGMSFLEIANLDTESVYITKASGSSKWDPEILIHRSSGIRRVAPDFGTWLKNVFQKLKREIPREHRTIVYSGPVPFDQREQAIVDARSRFVVSKESVDQFRNIVLRVRNESEMKLEYLSVYLGCNKGRSLSPVRVADVLPGTEALIPVNFYKRYPTLFDLKKVQVLKLPPIGPEDREILFELDGPPWFREAKAKGRKMGSEKDLEKSP